MKKTLLLAAAALFAASSSFASTWNVVGGNVNGSESWNPSANAMTEKSSNVYEWTGTELGSGFKITCDGDWGANTIISNGEKLEIGKAYSYVQADSASDDIQFANNVKKVTSPVVTLDLNAKTLTVTGTPEAGEPVDPSKVTYYIIGANVNGQAWVEGAADCAFTDQGNGIYRWEGDILGTGFKINDGTWKNDDINFGSNGSELYLDTPYYYAIGGPTGNIAFNGATEVMDPVVILDINEQTITVSGEGAGESAWYIMGINGNWDFIPEYMLLPVEGQEGVFANIITIVETAGNFKIGDTGWAHELGTNDPESVFIDANSMEITLDDVASGEGNIPYELAEGDYKVTLDYNEYTLTFSSDLDGVEEVVMTIGGKAEYFNLHGQKVANPDKGIYIQVVNGKATKVVK